MNTAIAGPECDGDIRWPPEKEDGSAFQEISRPSTRTRQ